ncbi:hypothetical protein GGR58DRAFT_517978 [Xylaria digitata]|nr:hypothetical protein GGR58DRAFT_517978 [Xylaria digitata]
MHSISGNRYPITGSLLAVAVLALLTLADNVLSNTLPFVLGPVPPQVPGFWNLTTTALILSVVSDIIGQLILMLLTHHSGSTCAIHLNNLSITIACVYSLVSFSWRADGAVWPSVIASIFKIVGGGSHATAFLTITLIWEKTSGSLRSALIYITGAVIVLSQTIASSVTPFLARQNPTFPYTFSIVCCVLASIVTVFYHTGGIPTGNREWISNSLVRPLLSPTVANQEAPSSTQLGFLEVYSQRWHNKSFNTRVIITLLGFIFLLAGIAKATRPLFTTYIQHRIGITPVVADYLWLIRTGVSLVIFTVVLPLIVILLSQSISRLPSTTNLYVAKISIILMAIGAFEIGVARSMPVLMSGLMINTLGVGTDLALLTFAADALPEDIGGYLFMAITLIESVAMLIGIWVLYPVYQFCLDDHTPLGGTPYYICAGLYTICGVIVWKLGLFTDL